MDWSSVVYRDTGERLTLREFFLAYRDRLPLMVRVAQGYFSTEDSETLSTGQVIWVHSFIQQKRVVAKELGGDGRTVSIPINYPVAFRAKKRLGGAVPLLFPGYGSPQPLGEILSKARLPLEVEMTAPTDQDFVTGPRQETVSSFSCLRLQLTFQEHYLVGHTLMEGKLYKKAVSVPLYLKNVLLTPLTGIEGVEDGVWARMNKNLDVLVRGMSLKVDLNLDIALYSQEEDYPPTADEESPYVSLEPLAHVSLQNRNRNGTGHHGNRTQEEQEEFSYTSPIMQWGGGDLDKPPPVPKRKRQGPHSEEEYENIEVSESDGYVWPLIDSSRSGTDSSPALGLYTQQETVYANQEVLGSLPARHDSEYINQSPSDPLPTPEDEYENVNSLRPDQPRDPTPVEPPAKDGNSVQSNLVQNLKEALKSRSQGGSLRAPKVVQTPTTTLPANSPPWQRIPTKQTGSCGAGKNAGVGVTDKPAVGANQGEITASSETQSITTVQPAFGVNKGEITPIKTFPLAGTNEKGTVALNKSVFTNKGETTATKPPLKGIVTGEITLAADVNKKETVVKKMFSSQRTHIEDQTPKTGQQPPKATSSQQPKVPRSLPLEVTSPQTHKVTSPQTPKVTSPQPSKVTSLQTHKVTSPQTHKVISPQTPKATCTHITKVTSLQTPKVTSPQPLKVTSPQPLKVTSPLPLKVNTPQPPSGPQKQTSLVKPLLPVKPGWPPRTADQEEELTFSGDTVHVCCGMTPQAWTSYVRSLNIAQLGEKLRELRLGKYETAFKEQMVDGALLSRLDEESLRNDFNMTMTEAIRLRMYVTEGHLPK